MMYHVVSDLPIVTGAPTIVVLPSKEEEYTITVSPWKRGKFEGILSFIAGSTQNLRDEPDDSDISSDQAERDLRPYSGKSSISSLASSSQNTGGSKIRDETSGYRVWFSLAVKGYLVSSTAFDPYSLIFQNATIGEFWYSLNLTAETPAPTTLPHMGVSGKWNVSSSRWNRRKGLLPLLQPGELHP
nr:cilia- and flagella-associated protein 47-like [Lytechinus pictus]